MKRLEYIQQDFEALLARSQGILFKVCRLYSHQGCADVDDLYQEMVYNLWKGYSAFRDEGKETAWVWRVAVNTANEQYRSRRHRPAVGEIPVELYESLAEEPPDGLQMRLYELIEHLDAHERRLLDLYLEDMPVKDMAVALRCSESTVNKRIYQLKQRLKELNEKVE